MLLPLTIYKMSFLKICIVLPYLHLCTALWNCIGVMQLHICNANTDCFCVNRNKTKWLQSKTKWASTILIEKNN